MNFVLLQDSDIIQAKVDLICLNYYTKAITNVTEFIISV